MADRVEAEGLDPGLGTKTFHELGAVYEGFTIILKMERPLFQAHKDIGLISKFSPIIGELPTHLFIQQKV